MVGQVQWSVEDVFSQKQLDIIVGAVAPHSAAEGGWRLVGHELRSAADGLTGFLGDHIRVTLHVKLNSGLHKIHLFVKSMPRHNLMKATFIDQGNYFRREQLSFQVFEKLGGDTGPTPWRPKAYIYTDSLLVMPDLSKDGYRPRPYHDTFDLDHVKLTAASIARFHAAYANYATKKTTDGNKCYNFLDEYDEVMKDPTFCDSPWVATAGKVSSFMINNFSAKYKNFVPQLEEKLAKLYVEACDSLREHKDTLNVLLHKDLWVNNILFKYDQDKPTNAVLIDYQCLRYGPPAFDLTTFLFLVTSRRFREQHEKEVFLHYYKTFEESLDDATKLRLKHLGYNEEEFLEWCEKARMFGMFTALGIFPYTLMDPLSAKKIFDDPETYMKYCFEERHVPVVEYAKTHDTYRERQVEVTEEFIERYVLIKYL